MPEAEETAPSPVDEFLDHILRVMRENERFLRDNASATYAEVVDLVSDFIDSRPRFVHEGGAEDYVRSPLAYFLNHVLLPLGGAMYVNLLCANLPACFSQLRTAHESLAKCYLAELRYTNLDFFRDKVFQLEDAARRDGVSITALMNDLDECLGFDRESVSLWSKLSQEWLHPRGLMNRMLQEITHKSHVPPWALVIPMEYTANELESLQELQRRVAEFRTILAAALRSGEAS